MTTLILVRHGESVTNLTHRLTGQLDVELTELGVRQAEAAAEYVSSKWHIDRIVSSDLCRAVRTARPFAERTGLTIETDAALREFNAGVWQGMEFKEIERCFPEAYAAWRKDPYNCGPENGENMKMLSERMIPAARRIASENEGKTVLITTHATPVRAMACVGMGMPSSRMMEINWVSNASITIMEYADGAFKMISCGITEHLDGMVTTLPNSI